MKTQLSCFLHGLVEFLKHSWPALALFVLATAIKVWLHESAPMDWLREQAFLAIHPTLTIDQKGELPLVIVDISHLDFESTEARKRPAAKFKKRSIQDYTPCGALSNILFEVSRTEPIAIGVDIDFSPDFTPGTEPPPDLPQFMQYCRSLGTPVYLGVGRGATRPPYSWLTGTSNIPMAAGILGFSGGHNIRLPTEIRYKDEFPLTSLSRALYRQYEKVADKKPHRIAEFVCSKLAGTSESTLGTGTNRFEVKSALVNYQFLPRLQHDSRCLFSADEVLWPEGESRTARQLREVRRHELMHDKLIIIGDATSLANPDKANVPGSANPEPGLFVHACAVCTQIEFPLQEVGEWKGIFLALLLLLLLLCGEWRITERHVKPHKISSSGSIYVSQTTTTKVIVDRQIIYSMSSKGPAILIFVTISQILVLVCITWLFARAFHLLWLDSISIAIAAIGECAGLIVYKDLKTQQK